MFTRKGFDILLRITVNAFTEKNGCGVKFRLKGISEAIASLHFLKLNLTHVIDN